MPQPDSTPSGAMRALIADFLKLKLEAKLEKIADDDHKRPGILAQFVPANWLADAARRVVQIQAVTHSLKPLHPDAKGSSLFREPMTLEPINEIGSHALGDKFETDVVGNAAALDIYKFLKLEHQGRSFLSLSIAADADLGAALSPDPAIAQAWMKAFAGLARARGKFRSHTQAKQIYWPVGSDPHDDAGYHLLAPLYPTSLVHHIYQALKDDRFGDAAKAARESRKANAWSESPVREYPNLAIQKLGGTKPQNISQLNSERRGENYMLASLPPMWQSPTIKPVLGVASLFAVFRWRREVRTVVAHIRHSLASDPTNNMATRARRDELVETLLDEFMGFTAEVHTLTPGWSADPGCDLPNHHMAWLDPEGPQANAVSSDTADRMASEFAHWLNGQLRKPLRLSAAEYLLWNEQARELFKKAEWEEAE